MESIRLNAYIASCGQYSRRAADRLIEEGRVSVNDAPASLGMRISDDDTVKIDGAVISPKKERVFVAVNKPIGVVCTEAHFKGEKTLQDLIDYPSRLFSIGRLDKASEGLILMTNDGAAAEEISRSKNNYEKEYEVRVNKPINVDFINKMRDGVEIEIDGKLYLTKKCRVKKTGVDTFNIILTQGLNRQIRRMCETLGYRVLALKRTRVSNIKLAGLNTGTYRRLREDEVSELVGKEN